MKKILAVALLLLLAACGSTKPQAKIPVWQAPSFETPSRPVLQSDGKGTDGEVARKLSNDLTNMEEYTFKLENILKAVKAQSGVSVTQTLDNNK